MSPGKNRYSYRCETEEYRRTDPTEAEHGAAECVEKADFLAFVFALTQKLSVPVEIMETAPKVMRQKNVVNV